MSENTEEIRTVNVNQPNAVRLVLLSLIILISGIIIGSAGTMLIQKKHPQKPAAGPGAAARMTHRLQERLDLTEAQIAEIEPVIKVYMDKLREIQEKARPAIREVLDDLKTDISKLLTEEQNEAWKRHLKAIERRFDKHRRIQKGPGGGRHRRGPGKGGNGPGRVEKGPKRRGGGQGMQRRRRGFEGDFQRRRREMGPDLRLERPKDGNTPKLP